MKLIVGLGNPGNKYDNTRHNVGFEIADRFAQDYNSDFELSQKANAYYTWAQIGDEKTEILKPQTFMNNSGTSVSYALSKHRELSVQDVFVIHDDLDIALGNYKIQRGRGPKDHNGISSIETSLGSTDFYRVRVGIENRGDSKIPGEDYVLMKFSDDEKMKLREIAAEIVSEISTMLTR